MKRLLLCFVLAASLTLSWHAGAGAQHAHDVSAFRLQATDFPPPATILTSRVEPNHLVDREKSITHFGASFATEGRITGYFMEVGRAHVGTAGSLLHPVVTSYLVSEFPSTDLAAAAFGQERNGWEDTIAHPTHGSTAHVVNLGPEHFGDLAARGLYVAKTPTAHGPVTVTELLFKRGIYVLEVFQSFYSNDRNPYGISAQPYVLRIGHKLDSIAAGSGRPLPPTPVTHLSFTVLSVRVEGATAKAGLHTSPLSRAKVGARLRFSVYVSARAPTPGYAIHVVFHLYHNGRSTRRSFTRFLATVSMHSHRYSVGAVTLRSPGTYTLVGTVTMGAVSHSRSARITIVRGGTLRPA